MPPLLKKHGLSTPFSRFFTRPDHDGLHLVPFVVDTVDSDEGAAIEYPAHWSKTAASVFYEHAAALAAPYQTKAVEENTVPSWLWRRRGSTAQTGIEESVKAIINRVVGGAAYEAWKLGAFGGETDARVFFDEARFCLASRSMALDPKIMSSLGTEWAFGKPASPVNAAELIIQTVELPNRIIDGVVSGDRDKNIRARWHQAASAKPPHAETSIIYSDVNKEWGAPDVRDANASIDIMSCRHNDGSLNTEVLRHLTRLLVAVLDLNDADKGSIQIGVGNLAALLMALGVAYDSEEGRSTVAAICGIVTAEAYSMSSELAALRGTTTDFAERQPSILRTLRNHRRSVYGERSDYEKISVLPVSLSLDACPDLALIAAVRKAWDNALSLAKGAGLRHTTVTSQSLPERLTYFMELLSTGIEPVMSLVTLTDSGDENFYPQMIQPVAEALTHFGYPNEMIKGINTQVVGALSLLKAPGPSLKRLKAKGFTAAALGRLETYLPKARDLRFVFTPWILGESFCRKVLKLSSKDLLNPRLNILMRLGFSAAEIKQANVYCYGADILTPQNGIREEHLDIFVVAANVTSEARVRMAAASQSFISGSTGLRLVLSATLHQSQIDKLLLDAWRQGLRSLSLTFGSSGQLQEKVHASERASPSQKPRTRALSRFSHVKAATLPAKRSKPRGALVTDTPSRLRTKISRRNWSR